MMTTETKPSVRALAWGLLAAAVLLALVWYVRYALMLIFGAVLVAVVLQALALPLRRLTGWREKAALAVVLLALIAAGAGTVWWLGDPIGRQIQSLSSELPHARKALRGWLEGSALGTVALDSLRDVSLPSLSLTGIAGVAAGALQLILAVVLVLVMGVYLAFDARLYQRGLVRLLPLPRRDSFSAALDESGRSLMHWLVGQLVMMVVIGVLVAAGLYFLDMRLALALGLIAGVFEFVPFFGPIASGVLAVLVAFAQGPQMALKVALLFLVLQQLEGNVLAPLVQRSAINLPPLLSVASVLVFGALFGLPGVMFGTPLAVVLMVMVRRLWVEQTLEGQPV